MINKAKVIKIQQYVQKQNRFTNLFKENIQNLNVNNDESSFSDINDP